MKRGSLFVTFTLIVVAAAFAPAHAADSSSPSATAARCPKGTTDIDGLCVARGATARQVADVVQSNFTGASLGAVVVGVWQGDKPLVVGALGESMTGVPATVEMHHIVGNITNAMLSTVLLQQVEQGKLSLDDKLSKYFPDLPTADEITIEMLENSTSGYRHYAVLDDFDAAFYADPFRHWAPEEIIAYGVEGGPEFTPGSKFLFSDTNFIIVAKVLEKATGTPMTELMREGVFEPLGMKTTRPPDTAAVSQPVLHAHTGERGVWEDSTYWDPSWTWYAGGIKSNQPELLKFLRALGTGKLLTKKSHERQLAKPAVWGDSDRYFALGVPVVNGWIFTNPSLQGYSGGLAYLPERQLSIIAYTTRTQRTDPDAAPATKIVSGITEVLAPDQAIPENPAG